MRVTASRKPPRFPRAFRGVTLGIACGLAAMVPRAAAAARVCDAGAVCPDGDNDGFAACGCAWSGAPCDCDDADPTTFPGAPETCDSKKDNNCSGQVADACPTNKGCFAGTCVPRCIPLDDFGCPSGSGFAPFADGTCLCAPDDCAVFGCPAGSTCNDSKVCVPNCDPSVRCPNGQICRGFGCVEPCAEVTCPEGSVCASGTCQPSCSCNPGGSCPPGETCDLTLADPACVDVACVGVHCPEGSRCAQGACVDLCEGVVCPLKQVCRKVSVNGAPPDVKCVDLCSFRPCNLPYVCDWRTGDCTPGPPLPPLEPPALPSNDPLDEVSGAGWLCTTSGLARASAFTALSGAGAVIGFGLRRRRRRADRPRWR